MITPEGCQCSTPEEALSCFIACPYAGGELTKESPEMTDKPDEAVDVLCRNCGLTKDALQSHCLNSFHNQPDEAVNVTDAGLFPRIVSHDEAQQAAKNFIDAHFNNKGGKGVLTGVPARDDHDDLVLSDYIKQQRVKDSQRHGGGLC